ncbi:hypothetical protein PMIT1318_01762 [Prochlorococcus marinus str. MIT 1318]|nr:hypothetical protein PMIT1318_01762 [Prochlorococcus marinus str. MIT 1318]
MLREAHQKFAVKPMGRACNQRMDQVVGRLAVTESQAEKNRFKQNFFYLGNTGSEKDLAIYFQDTVFSLRRKKLIF